MVESAFEQSCIIEGEIRLYSVLHGVSECVQLILHGVITMYHTMLSQPYCYIIARSSYMRYQTLLLYHR
jgi:hypothetical protein